MVVLNLDEAQDLARVIRGQADADFFHHRFAGKYSEEFDPDRDLARIGVVNQTTMLATETQAIATLLRDAMVSRYGAAGLDAHFADTNDTLCYATNENQSATRALIDDGADLALIVGGFNSSNTSHLAELCEEVMPTYFVRGAEDVHGPERITHFDLHRHVETETRDWLPANRPVDVLLTAGASCPDTLLDEVVRRMNGWFEQVRDEEDALAPFAEAAS